MEVILKLFEIVFIYFAIFIAYVGWIPCVIISAIIAFIIPAIVVEAILIALLIIRFNWKKLLCLIVFSVLSFLSYSTLALDYGLDGLDSLANFMFFGSLFAVFALIFLLLFFIYDGRIKREQNESISAAQKEQPSTEENVKF